MSVGACVHARAQVRAHVRVLASLHSYPMLYPLLQLRSVQDCDAFLVSSCICICINFHDMPGVMHYRQPSCIMIDVQNCFHGLSPKCIGPFNPDQTALTVHTTLLLPTGLFEAVIE